MNKKGQFYIVAAIIIVLALSGIASTTTYASVKSKPRTIESLSLDLKEESSRIIDYGVYNSEDLSVLLDKFTDTDFAPYFLHKTDNANVVFIYGNRNNLNAVKYKREVTGTISASIGGGTDWKIVSNFAERGVISDDDNDDKVDVTLLEKTYTFDLKDNEMFYFVMVQEKEGEEYVERN